MTASEEFCSQCYGKGWVRLQGRRVECIACIMRRDRARSRPAESEHRDDRPYDEADPSTLRHPNGSLIASFHRGFLAAATRCVLGLYSGTTA